jgi:hypothetical protein
MVRTDMRKEMHCRALQVQESLKRNLPYSRQVCFAKVYENVYNILSATQWMR